MLQDTIVYALLLCIVVVACCVAYYFLDKKERFELAHIKRGVQAKKKAAQALEVRTLHGSSPAVKGLMADLNRTGNQLRADSMYDTVDMSFMNTHA
jgi:hypothetical protein